MKIKIYYLLYSSYEYITNCTNDSVYTGLSQYLATLSTDL